LLSNAFGAGGSLAFALSFSVFTRTLILSVEAMAAQPFVWYGEVKLKTAKGGGA
jgi:hypothetical protein